MECDRILELLPARLDGSLEANRETEVEMHLQDCPRCAAEEEALKETLALLRNLPPEKAPPALLEGVRRKIAAETRQAAAGKGLFSSARIRIPLEAAAAVLLFLLVYGIQRQTPVTDRPAAPPVRVETASPSPEAEAGKRAPMERRDADTGRSESAASPPTETAQSVVPPQERVGTRKPAPAGDDRVETAGDRATEPPHAAKTSLPAVPATRVSTGAESVVPRAREEERAEAPAPFRVFAAPPSRLLRPMPYGREVILEVGEGQRPGLEDRIVRVVEGFGGSFLREWHSPGTPSGEAGDAPVSEGPLRIQIPAGSAEAFLSELRKLGTIPPEGMPESIDLPAGPTPDVAAYTVRIRVR